MGLPTNCKLSLLHTLVYKHLLCSRCCPYTVNVKLEVRSYDNDREEGFLTLFTSEETETGAVRLEQGAVSTARLLAGPLLPHKACVLSTAFPVPTAVPAT